ncbi:MAG: dienelactone hydrolase family protein [Pseudomonadota bacterium]
MSVSSKRLRAACVMVAVLVALSTRAVADAQTGETLAQPLSTLAGISYVETVTGGAAQDAELPMLLALHYMGGSPDSSIADYGDVEVPLRLLSLAGPHEFRNGYSWFTPGYYELDSNDQRTETFAVAERIAEFIREALERYPTHGAPLLTGYSQGADLTHVIALREPELIAAGLPMGGRFPTAWHDERQTPAPLPQEIVLFHGAADEAVDVAESLAAARYYTAQGVNVTLHTYADVGHAYPARMKADYEAAVRRLLRSPE